MLTNKKTYGKAKSMPVGFAWGTSVALIITIAFAIVMTQMVLGGKLSETAIGTGAMVVLPVASAVSAIIASGVIKRRRMQVCMLSGAIYLMSLILINILFFGGQFGGLGVTILLTATGAMIVGIWGLKGKKKVVKKGKRWGSR